ncbi:MAG: hypothetical protein BMS9Abin11_0882 [Gammaproteobacteria bacterium]|nr:MAG: hypothetical protein BMS9Abin11_0882 [Gammaproteobacteria bacterium]
MKKRNRDINIFNMSALDLFATATGVFLVIALVLMPYYLKTNKSILGELRKTRIKLANCKKGRQSCQAKLAKVAVRDFDIVFVMDTTGSMSKQIYSLRENLNGIVRVLGKLAPKLRVGFVAYRDHGEPYVTQKFPITRMNKRGYQSLKGFLSNLQAKGGGDHPEAVQEGLRKAIQMRWRAKVRRIIIVIGDAQAHPADFSDINSMVTAFSNRSRRNHMVSAIFTARRGTRYFRSDKPFFELLARNGKGAYVEEPSRMLESILISVLQKTRG